MLHESLLLIISLLFAVSMLVMLGQKLRISYPIFLVLGGLLISLVPGITIISIDPELIFLIFLPPILYEAAWYTSWNDFWKWKRPISLLAFGLVIFTSCIVAYVSSAMIPGFTLALGFLLGGIISPPDAVAATSVLKGIKMPKRIVTILEGESLINDASSLIVFRFALAAVITRHFVLEEAIVDFFLVAIMGILTGLAVGYFFYLIHRFLPTTPSIDTALTLMTPYIMYLAAEHFNVSGVMAVVSGGLFLSYHSHTILNHSSRIQANGVWSTVIFILNGIVFILIGLELPVIIGELNGYSISDGIRYGIVISLLTILIRFIWVYPIAFIPRWLSKKVRTTEKSPGWQGPLIISWAGMRGVVSLASALAIPLTLSNGHIFPERNIILFITFIVILITLVVQGLTLPFIVRFSKIDELDDFIPEEEQEANIQLRLKKAALNRLNEKYLSEITENELVENLKNQLENDIALTTQRLESLECDTMEKEEIALYNRIMLDLFNVQRSELGMLRKEKVISHDLIRKQENRLDLDTAKLYQ